MILIHPAVASNPTLLIKLQLATGLRAICESNRALLTRPTAINNRRNAAAASVHTFNHHSSPLRVCTHCEVRTNVQMQGEQCWRCRRGVIVNDSGNGGSAA